MRRGRRRARFRPACDNDNRRAIRFVSAEAGVLRNVHQRATLGMSEPSSHTASMVAPWRPLRIIPRRSWRNGLSSGAHLITAVYAGNSSLAASVSSPASVTIHANRDGHLLRRFAAGWHGGAGKCRRGIPRLDERLDVAARCARHLGDLGRQHGRFVEQFAAGPAGRS